MNPTLILVALLALPPSRFDRNLSQAERAYLLAPVALAISEAAHDVREVAELEELGRAETNYASLVMTGHCDEMPAGERCDHGHARGPWSVHDWCKRGWAYADGSLESLEEQARCAVHMLRYQASRGREHAPTPLHAAFAGYAARDWHWPGADRRVRGTLAREAELYRLAASSSP